jgi:hypothetical protein
MRISCSLINIPSAPVDNAAMKHGIRRHERNEWQAKPIQHGLDLAA